MGMWNRLIPLTISSFKPKAYFYKVQGMWVWKTALSQQVVLEQSPFKLAMQKYPKNVLKAGIVLVSASCCVSGKQSVSHNLALK